MRRYAPVTPLTRTLALYVISVNAVVKRRIPGSPMSGLAGTGASANAQGSRRRSPCLEESLRLRWDLPQRLSGGLAVG
jgi:hypothetical protein